MISPLATLDSAMGGFNLATAQVLADYCRRAYEEATITSAAECHALIEETDTALIVAFRGTHTPQDFILDSEAWRFQTAHFGVHWGFWNSICSIARDVNDAVLKLYKGSTSAKPFYITGHSLGGALAALYAVQFSPRPSAVYTFGQPRTGDSRFRDIYNAALGSHTWRIVNEEDIVPRVPGVLAGYRHVGHEVFLPAIGTQIHVDPSIGYKLISDFYGLITSSRSGEELIHDHAIESYIARMESIALASTTKSNGHTAPEAKR